MVMKIIFMGNVMPIVSSFKCKQRRSFLNGIKKVV